MKRFLSVLLVLAIIIACAPVVPLQVNAATSGYYTYTVSNGEATITGCVADAPEELVIPDTIAGYPVTSIGGEAFRECGSITSIILPNSITSIGGSAFECSSLTNISMGDSVVTIGAGAFWCCGLTSITIPDSVTSIGSNAFEACSSLTSVIIGDGITSISTRAFSGCSSLTSIVLPNSVTSIDPCAFIDSGLTSITIGDNITNIERYAFDGCTDLANVYYCGTEGQRANIAISSGNDCLTSATWHYIDAVILHKQGEVKNYYKTLEEALAVTGGTIQLLANVTADVVNLNADVTLDLNGYTLTADSVSGKVMDSQDGEGLIKVSAQSAVLSSNDDQLILWDNATGNAGYRVFNYTFTNMGLDAHGDDESESAKYGATVKSVWSDLVFTNSYAYTLAASTYSGLQVGFELSWTPDGGETASKTFNFNAATVGAWGTAEEGSTGAENYCFYIRVTGFEELLASGMVTVKPVVSTAFNAAETAVTEMRYEYTEPNPGGLEYEVGFGIVPQM